MAKGKHEAPSKGRLAREYSYTEQPSYAPERRSPRPRRGKRNLLPLLAALSLIVGMAVGGTVAYLTDSSELMGETYVAARVDCQVQPDYSVVNTGNIPAYIRVAMVQNYVNGEGSVHGAHPAASLLAPAEGWSVIDGWYYHNLPVEPGTAVQPASAFTSAAAEDGCIPQLQIIAEAIQAQPVNAVQEAWGVTPVTVEELP